MRYIKPYIVCENGSKNVEHSTLWGRPKPGLAFTLILAFMLILAFTLILAFHVPTDKNLGSDPQKVGGCKHGSQTSSP